MKKQLFVLEINSTQNQNWQGRVEWIQGKNKKGFRSVMELLRLLNSAVEENDSAEERIGAWERD